MQPQAGPERSWYMNDSTVTGRIIYWHTGYSKIMISLNFISRAQPGQGSASVFIILHPIFIQIKLRLYNNATSLPSTFVSRAFLCFKNTMDKKHLNLLKVLIIKIK